MTLFDLTGKVAVVTGSTKGIGRAIAERYCEHGARVVVTSRNADDCAAVAAELEQRWPGQAVPCSFDLVQRDTLQAPVRCAVDRWGRLDVLVCNAVVPVIGTIDQITDEDLDYNFSANLTNNLALIRHALPHLRAQGAGSIIQVGSTLGHFPSPPFLAYGMQKAALAHMTGILAVDLGRENIRVNGIVPGITRTESTKAYAHLPDVVAKVMGKTPLGRLGEADEMAAVAVLLASPGGAYITGQCIIVDGGQIHQGREAASGSMDSFV